MYNISLLFLFISVAFNYYATESEELEIVFSLIGSRSLQMCSGPTLIVSTLPLNEPLKIINGTNAEEGEFPYMVQLRGIYGFFTCGGSIIAPKWILTAGHCVFDDGIESIVYGTNKLYSIFDGFPNTSIKVKKSYFRNHNQDKPYDVGLIELETEIPFGDNAKPIILPKDDNIPFHIKGVLTGWGRKTDQGDVAPYLQKIYLGLQTGEECTKAFNKDGKKEYNSTIMLCPENNWNGECLGDSGGPYVVNGTQYGIVSWSYKPCGSQPGVYTRVSFPGNREWIRNITNI